MRKLFFLAVFLCLLFFAPVYAQNNSRLEVELKAKLGQAGSLGYNGSQVKGEAIVRYWLTDKLIFEGGAGTGITEKIVTGDGQTSYFGAGLLYAIKDRWRIGPSISLVRLDTTAFDKAALYLAVTSEVDVGKGITITTRYLPTDLLPYVNDISDTGVPESLNRAKGFDAAVSYTRQISPRYSFRISERGGMLRFKDDLQQTRTGGFADTSASFIIKF